MITSSQKYVKYIKDMSKVYGNSGMSKECHENWEKEIKKVAKSRLAR